MYIVSNYIPSPDRMPRIVSNTPTTTLAITTVGLLSLYILTQSRSCQKCSVAVWIADKPPDLEMLRNPM